MSNIVCIIQKYKCGRRKKNCGEGETSHTRHIPRPSLRLGRGVSATRFNSRDDSAAPTYVGLPTGESRHPTRGTRLALVADIRSSLSVSPSPHRGRTAAVVECPPDTGGLSLSLFSAEVSITTERRYIPGSSSTR